MCQVNICNGRLEAWTASDVAGIQVFPCLQMNKLTHSYVIRSKHLHIHLYYFYENVSVHKHCGSAVCVHHHCGAG